MAEYLFNHGIILILYISLSALYTVGAKQKVFLSSPSFLLCSSGPDRHVPKTKATPFTGSRLLPASSQQFLSAAAVCQSVCLSVHPSINSVCVCYFCVGVFYSALPLYKSTVAPGQSLGIGKREGGVSWGASQTHCHPGWFRGL